MAPDTPPASGADPVVDAVCADLQARSARGLLKYGTPLARTDLALRDWLQHAYEEALDLALYLKRARLEIEETANVR